MGKFFYSLVGLFSGFLNGLFGAGGGVVVVPMLGKGGLEPRKAHATSVAIILALSIVSTISYWIGGTLDVMQALKYVPGGLVGAIVGALCLKKIPNTLLRRIFGSIIIVSAVRLLLK
ncbi:MAG TPA: sulfite exporter TauE/SafE family protein [Oscillospiraceae bacterium]|nr:sulfite exporter TauE/SafE family protein [Oscillospiraceae bacterium]